MAEHFEGHDGRECGEHRTTGRRAWCFNCQEWCYPDIPCKGCELPSLRTEVDHLRRTVAGQTATAPANSIPIHGYMVPDADIETILADPGGACPDCVRIVIEGLRAEVERLRAELAKGLHWEARLAERVLSGQDATNDLAEQIRRAWMVAAEMHEFNSPDGDHLEGCPGCRIEAALSGTEAGQ